jgi:hypothetical protein
MEQKTPKVVVQFTSSWRIYREGDVAGFDALTARNIVAAGVAFFVPRIEEAHTQVHEQLQEVAPSPPMAKQVEIVVTPEGAIDTMPTKRKWARRSR